MEVPLNSTYEKQSQKLLPKTFRKAYISAVNLIARTADIYFANNPTVIIRGVPVASNVSMSQAMVGQKCKVDIFDEINQRDMVVAYCYGSSSTAVTGYTGTFQAVTSIGIDFVFETYGYGTALMTFQNGVLVDVQFGSV